MTLSVIGLGFGRTGTESLKKALEILGCGPCYHMFEVLPHQDRVDEWVSLVQGKTPDWDKTFAGYHASADWPGAFFWRELATHYADAKFVLTTRDPGVLVRQHGKNDPAFAMPVCEGSKLSGQPNVHRTHLWR